MSKTSGTSGASVHPVLPLRDIVVFPHMIVPLFVGREKSIKALEDVMGAEKQSLLATQLNAADDDPQPDAIYDVGTLANVLQLLKLPDGTVKVLVEGTARARITGFTGRDSTPEAIAPLLDKQMPGFGELFRALSFEEIATSSLQSRAFAGLANATFIFCLPGSTGACRTAWEKLLRAQLDARTKPCNLVGLRPRLLES